MTFKNIDVRIFALACLLFVVFFQAKTIHVSVKINGLKNGVKVYLKNNSKVDSATFSNGAVDFDVEKAKSTPYQIAIYTAGRTLMIYSFIDDGDLTIKGTMGKSYETYSYVGSNTQNDYLTVYQLVHPDEEAIKLLKASGNSKKATIIDSLEKSIVQKQFSFSKNNPHSSISPILLYGAMKFKKVSKEQASTWYTLLGEDIKITSIGKTLGEDLNKYH